jgi:ComF family protein
MDQKIFRQIYHSLTSAFFPNRCLACNRLYHLPFSFSEQNRNTLPQDMNAAFTNFIIKFVCGSCSPNFSIVESPVCIMCGMMFVSREGGDHLCGKCQKNPKHFATARAAVVYDNLMMNAILQLKYHGRIKLAKPLGSILLFAFLHYFSGQDLDIIIPVPLYPGKLKQRGFNQVFLMIQDWEKQLPENGYRFPFSIHKKILQKNKNTKAQTGLNKDQRVKNIKNSFHIENQSDISGKNVLLVDDVYTTGSTVNECARMLKKGGARRVDVLTLARTI